MTIEFTYELGEQDTCQKCGSKENLTLHHIDPRRFGRKTEFVTFCRDCHDLIELLIEKEDRLDPGYYYNLVHFFIISDEITYPKKPRVSRTRHTWLCPYCQMTQKKPNNSDNCKKCVIGVLRPIPKKSLPIAA